MITEENFTKIIPDVNWDYAKKYVGFFETVLPKYKIDTPLRKAHFLAQITHESGGFKYTVENLNYSAKALYNVFRKHFPTLEAATAYARQPEKIASKVYANRMENGDEASKDGWTYRGRGLIQLTGKHNYRLFSAASGEDVIANPDLLASPQWALASACWFWDMRKLNAYADDDDIHMITKRINGGVNGLENRQHFLDEYKKIYNIS